MFLSIATTHAPATDLGFLVHKHPGRIHEARLPFGTARLFYPRADEARCELALVLDLDPVALVRPQGHAAAAADGYVNDRPYAASAFLAVAIGRTMREAMGGRSRERPDLASRPIPLEATVCPVRAVPGDMARRLFEPLGYDVGDARIPLDPARPDWGDGPYVALTLRAEARLADLLAHLAVLVPVLDGGRRHHWIGDDEVEKLLARGAGWLAGHPERDRVVEAYLGRHGELVRAARERLGLPAPERAPRLADLRADAVAAAIARLGARRVLDLGCGEGRLLCRLAAAPGIDRAVGLDADPVAADRARAALARLPPDVAGRAEVLNGALGYRDDRLKGFDAAVLSEVIEHVDPARLPAVERAVFGHARPRAVAVTTPNAEHNAAYGLGPGEMRHDDHRFELGRAGFAAWCGRVGEAHGYAHEILPVGEPHPDLGPPTQMALFTLKEARP